MIHDVGLLDADVELDRLTTFCFASGTVFVIFIWPLHGVLLRLFLKYFTLLRGVSGAMQ